MRVDECIVSFENPMMETGVTKKGKRSGIKRLENILSFLLTIVALSDGAPGTFQEENSTGEIVTLLLARNARPPVIPPCLSIDLWNPGIGA
jgi:hypothetical protein